MTLLRRKEADAAQGALRGLSRALRSKAATSIPDASLASGQAGLAIAHVVLAPMFPDAGHGKHATRALDRAIAALASTPMRASLHSGFTGVAWVAELLHGDASVPPEDDGNAAIDEALLGYVDRSPWEDPYDLIEGLVGLGVYALERMPRASGKALVAAVVDRLAETAVKQKPGVSWRSDPAWIPPELVQDPFPTWNLGVAHGVPGVIAMLGGVCAAGVDRAVERKAHALLEKAVAWTLAKELPRSSAGRFAYASGDRVPKVPSRAAWCYGDPGLAAALLVAARATHERTWTKHAIRIALAAAERPIEGSGITDAGLCHGAAGLGHIFHRMHRTTGEPRLADAARTWLARALAMRTALGGVAGFLTDVPDGSGSHAFHADPTLLTGGAGIALALAAAVTEADPGWDRAFLLSALSARSARASRKAGASRDVNRR